MVPELTRVSRRRRVWCETLPLEELASPAVVALLVRYRLDVLVAVTPETRAGLASALRALHGAGVHAAIWPMIGDADGRWASARTLARYVAFVDEVTAGLAREAVPLAEVAIDLEPPFSVAQAASHGALLGPFRVALDLREEYARAAEQLRDYVTRLGATFSVSCAAVPLVLLDEEQPRDRPFYQGLLGTPIDGVRFGSVSVMAYTSILEGWSRGLLDRRSAVGVLAECARLARARYGDRASVSVGTVGTGAFADEPIYRDPSELAVDVAVARAYGVDDLSLFDLGGLVRRGPAEAWLDAFVGDGERPRDLPRRVRIGSAALRALAKLR